jgi:hypothetical protein
MFDVTGSLDRVQGEELGWGPHIRLRADHPSHHRAARLLVSLGGNQCPGTEGLVFRFITTPAQAEALGLARSQMGWSVASAFDGSPWLPSDPAARWVTGSAVEPGIASAPWRR